MISQKDYNRYQNLKKDGVHRELLPLIKISESPTDKYEIWKENSSRYDILSQKYYNNPHYDFLIHHGNLEYLSQFDIPNGALIRIPFPLKRALDEYENSIING